MNNTVLMYKQCVNKPLTVQEAYTLNYGVCEFHKGFLTCIIWGRVFSQSSPVLILLSSQGKGNNLLHQLNGIQSVLVKHRNT